MLVKICGITRVEDVDVCADCGVDWIGLNLWPGSKRFVPREQALRLAERSRARGLSPVALLVGAAAADIAALAATEAFDRLQLYEPPTGLPTGLAWIRCLKVRDRLPDLAAPTDAAWDLIETDVAGHGGAGRRFDWSLLAAADFARPTLIAGGLGPENVGELLSVFQPWGIDLASGVESAPGVKDPAKVRTLMETVRALRKDPA